MRRREFIAGLGGAAVWPLGVRAQRPAMRVIGFLHTGSPEPNAHRLAVFREGLGGLGYVEGQNVIFEYRWAAGSYDRLPVLAAELVRLPADVVVTAGGEPAAFAAKAATTTIPVAVIMGRDLAIAGLVTSLSRPGGNLTGVMQFTSELTAKRLGLLREMVPAAQTIALLVNPKNPNVETQMREGLEAARSVGLHLHILSAAAEAEIEGVFASLADLQASALFVGADGSFTSRRSQIVALAARHALPTIYEVREFAEAGGLMSYGADPMDAYRQLGIYAGRILDGARPADLPVIQSTKFELVINLKTARDLGIDMPPTLLARADEVIE